MSDKDMSDKDDGENKTALSRRNILLISRKAIERLGDIEGSLAPPLSIT